MDYTQNLHLPQWEESDRIMMDDFNDAMAAIDAAMPRIVTGSYTGDGTYGSEHPTTLTFDFKPRMVLLFNPGGQNYHGICIPGESGSPYMLNDNTSISVRWSENTVSLWSGSSDRQFNATNYKYYYVAIQ